MMSEITSYSKVREYCANYGWAMMHRVFHYRHVFGEPSIKNGWLIYASDRSIVVVGYPLSPLNAQIPCGVADIAIWAMSELKIRPQTIVYWGTHAPKIDFIPGYQLKSAAKRPQFYQNDILSIDADATKILYERRDIRRSFREGYRSIITYGLIEGIGDLANRFISEKKGQLEVDDFWYIDALDKVISDVDSVIIGATTTHLQGAIVLSVAPPFPVYLYGFFPRGSKWASTFLYFNMIKYCVDMGFDRIDLGYSPSDSLRSYKSKWGAVHGLGVPWEIIFEKRL